MIWTIRNFKSIFVTTTLSLTMIVSCQKSNKSSDDGNHFEHPNAAGNTTTIQQATSRVSSTLISTTEDTVITFGGTTVTIPLGAVSATALATLKPYGGVFVNSAAVTQVSEPVILAIVDSTGADIKRENVLKDIQVEIESANKVASKKLAVMLHEDGGLSTATKTGISNSALGSNIEEVSSGKYKVSFKMRHARIAMVLANSGGSVPAGYESFIAPPEEVTELAGAPDSPAAITLTWTSNGDINKGFTIVRSTDSTPRACTIEDEVTAVLTNGTYSYQFTNLDDATTYYFRVCATSFRDPEDITPGELVSVATPARARAVLSNTPNTMSNLTALNVTVGGDNVVSYKYAFTTGSSCTGATYSTSWIAISTHITDSISGEGAKILCVLGKIDSTNEQLVPTTSTWTADFTPPTFTSLALAGDALDLYINATEKLNTTNMTGTLTASGYDGVSYIAIADGTSCNGPLSYVSTVQKSSSHSGFSNGLYKVCVRLYDNAGNITYGNTSTYEVDYTYPVFTSATLANSSSDGYINNGEKNLNQNIVDTATGSGFTDTKYVEVASNVTCNGALTYSATIPQNSSAVLSSDGTYKVCVRLADAAGNITYGYSSDVIRKTTLPAFTSLNLGTDVSNGFLSISEHALTNPLATGISGSNYDTAAYTVIEAANNCSDETVFGAMPNDNNAAINSHDTLYKVCVKLTDNAGNPAAYGSTSNFRALLSIPTCTSVTLANDVANGYLNATEHGSTNDTASGTSGDGSTVSTVKYVAIASATTCDGAQTFGNSIPKSNNSIFDSNGTYKICAQVADAESQYGYCQSSNFVVDISTITFTSIDLAGPATDTYINTSEHTTNSNIVNNLSAANHDTAQYIVVASATTCNNALTYSGSVPKADNTNISSDGATYKVCVELTDLAGNTPAYGESAVFTYDNSAPTFTSLPLANAATDTYINIVEHTLTSNVVGPLTAADYVTAQYALVDTGTTCGAPLSWVANIAKADSVLFTSVGAYKQCVQLTDIAGNIAYFNSPDINFDDDPPVFTSIDLANDAANTYINLAEFSNNTDVVNNLVASGQATTQYVLVSDGTSCSGAGGYANAVTKSSDFSGANGDYKVCVKLVDAAGNPTHNSSATIHLDKEVPSFSSIALANDATDTYINATEKLTTNNLTGAASGSGHNTASYALVADGTDCTAQNSWSGSIPKSNSGDFGLDGDYIICVKLSDNAGNPNAFGSSAAIHLDTAAPVFTSLALAGDATDGYLNTVERTHSTTIVGTLTTNGHAAATFKVVTNVTTCDVNLTYQADEKADTNSIPGEGTYKICARFTDTAGNIDYDDSANFVVDLTPPIFTSLARGTDVSNGYLNAAEHAGSSSLGGALTASGNVSNAYVFATSATTCNESLTYGGMPNTDDAGLLDNTTYKVCAKLTDVAGNITYGESLTWTTDYLAPSIASVTLAAVVSDGYLNISDDAAASNLISSVNASNHDSLGYIVELNSGTCNSSLTYSGTIPKTNNGNFTSDDSWKVCVVATDLAGNPSAYMGSNAIIRDLVKPASTVTTTGNITPTSTAGSTTNIVGTSSDATAGVSSMSISLQEGAGNCFDATAHNFEAACPNWISSTGTTSWQNTLDDSDFMKGVVYTVSSKATDSAGNVQTAFGTNTFTYTAAEGVNLWSRNITFDSASAEDKPLAGAVDSQGNLYVVGYHTNGDKNIFIKKFSKRGVEDTINWSKNVGDNGVDELARGIAIDASDNVYITGSKWNGSNWDWFIKKYNSSGTEDTAQWNKTVDSGNGHDEANAIVTDSSGNVYIAGYGTNIAGGSSGEDIWMKKYNAAGTQQCELLLDAGASNLADRGTAIAIDPAGSNVFVGGFQTVSGPDQSLVIKKLATSNCAVLKTGTENRAGTMDLITGLKVSADGSDLFASGVNTESDADWWILKFPTNNLGGAQMEERALVAGSHAPLAVAIDSNDMVYIGGYKGNATQDGWLRQFLPNNLNEDTGNWNKVLDLASANDQITAVIISGGTNDLNNVYVIGWGTNIIGGSSGSDWWITKYAGQ